MVRQGSRGVERRPQGRLLFVSVLGGVFTYTLVVWLGGCLKIFWLDGCLVGCQAG